MVSRKKLLFAAGVILILIYPGCKKEIPGIIADIKETGKDSGKKSTEIIESAGFPLLNVGYAVYDPEKNTVVESRNMRKGFIPASVTKIPTTVAALKILGHQYRFRTILASTGQMTGGTLQGNLYLKGTGDPLLKAGDLMELARILKTLGIKKVSGKFFFDDTELVKGEMICSDMKIDASYNTGYGALSMDFNLIHARWDKEKPAKKIDFFLVPALNLYKPVLSDKKMDDETVLSYENNHKQGEWLLSRDVKSKGSRLLPVKDSGVYTAQMFAKLASIIGISIPQPEPGRIPEDAHEIHAHQGKPLIEIVEIILTYSNNLMAELLHLTAAKKLTGKTMDLADSGAVMAGFFSEKIKKLSWDGFTIINGSGLTGKNRITPEQMTGILLYADSETYNGRSYYSLLPVSGWKGSLEGRMSRPETAFQVWAKTGGINYASSLAGVLYTKTGRRLIFTVFISDHDMRTKLESENKAGIKGKAEKNAATWSKKSTQVIDDLVKEWILELN